MSHLKYHLEKNSEKFREWGTSTSKNDIALANDCLNRWVVDNDQPFTVVEHPGFRALLRSMNHKNTRIAESVLQSAEMLRSTFTMLSRAMHLKQSLQSMMQTDKELRKLSLTETEWETLDALINLLKDNEKNYPSVAQMAKDYLAISATSVPCERAFSAGTDLISPKRGNLKPDTIMAMMSLKLCRKTGN